MTPDENELWIFHCYVWGIGCSGEHDPSCDDGETGHYALADKAMKRGFPAGGSWDDPSYRQWLSYAGSQRTQEVQRRQWQLDHVLSWFWDGTPGGNSLPEDQTTWVWKRERIRIDDGYLLCPCGEYTLEGGEGRDVHVHPDFDEYEPGNPLKTRGGYTLTTITCCCGKRLVLATGNHKGMFAIGLFSVTAPAPPRPTFKSPIEQKFWDAWQATPSAVAFSSLTPQYPVRVNGHNYRLDFAVPGLKVGIELDGFASHSSTADIANDRRRQREIESQGWRIIRFGGSEVHHDAARCALEVLRLMGGPAE